MIQLYGFVCGRLTAPMGAFLEGAEGTMVDLPVPAYLIFHDKGTAVFDTGLHLTAQSDPAAAFGAFLAGVFEPRFAPGDELAARLGALGHEPARIDVLINSHLHFDHCGGNAQVPNATLVVQRREWEAAQDSDLGARNGFDARNHDLGHRLQLVDGEYDLFGDGSAVLFPTYGHTPGHQSLRLRGAAGETVLTADCCYFHSVLDSLHLPPFGHDKPAQKEAIGRLKALRDRGAHLVFGHDPAQWPEDAPRRLA